MFDYWGIFSWNVDLQHSEVWEMLLFLPSKYRCVGDFRVLLLCCFFPLSWSLLWCNRPLPCTIIIIIITALRKRHKDKCLVWYQIELNWGDRDVWRIKGKNQQDDENSSESGWFCLHCPGVMITDLLKDLSSVRAPMLVLYLMMFLYKLHKHFFSFWTGEMMFIWNAKVWDFPEFTVQGNQMVFFFFCLFVRASGNVNVNEWINKWINKSRNR